MKLFKALLRLIRPPKRHYPVFSGHQWTCNCGHSSAWDPQLREHFRNQGEVS